MSKEYNQVENKSTGIFQDFENNSDRIKKYLSLLVLIPTILGGFWQFFNLSSIGLHYLRFFSFSQLISDGLTILMPIAFTSLMIISFLLISRDFYKDFKINDKKEYLKIIMSIIVSLLSTVSLIYILIKILPFILQGLEIKLSVNFMFFLYAFLLPLVVFNYNSTNNLTKLFNVNNNYSSGFLKCVLLLDFASVFGFIYVVGQLIISVNYLAIPNNLVNIDNIHYAVKRDYNLERNNYEISYMNDTYIFIEKYFLSDQEIKKLKDSNKRIPTKVIMYKIDELFSKNSLPFKETILKTINPENKSSNNLLDKVDK